MSSSTPAVGRCRRLFVNSWDCCACPSSCEWTRRPPKQGRSIYCSTSCPVQPGADAVLPPSWLDLCRTRATVLVVSGPVAERAADRSEQHGERIQDALARSRQLHLAAELACEHHHVQRIRQAALPNLAVAGEA